MKKYTVKLRDTSFQGPSFGMGGTNPDEPKYLVWDRYYTSDRKQVFTDSRLMEAVDFDAEYKIGILIESPAIRPYPYEWVAEYGRHLDTVLTFKKSLVDLGGPFKFYALGGSWIPLEEWGMHEKTKDTSIIVSQKTGQEGHKLRHAATELDLDVYGRGVGKWIHSKTTALRDYRFAVIIENIRTNFYFTEKLIDCLSQGTIPIYWGCDVSEFFDMNGIIAFDSIDGLAKILEGLTPDFYEERREAVKQNLKFARRYRCPEDWIWKRYPGLLK